MPARTVALVGAVCLTAGWLLASVLTPPVARVQGLPERRAGGAAGAPDTPGTFTDRLTVPPQPPPAPSPGRNPFAFGDRRVAAAGDAPVAEIPAPAVDVPAPTPAVGPLYSLTGMAITETASGPVRTAVLSDGRTVHLVTAGQTLGGHRILEITDDAVTIEAPTGVRSVLRLR